MKDVLIIIIIIKPYTNCIIQVKLLFHLSFGFLLSKHCNSNDKYTDANNRLYHLNGNFRRHLISLVRSIKY